MIKIGGYLIDVATEESVSYETEVTEYPVESGGVVTDHTQNRVPVLTIEFTVSDSPIGEVAKARGPGSIPSSEARNFLLVLRDGQEPFTVECSLGTFPDMVFQTLEETKDSGTGAALTATATFRRINIQEVTRTVVAITEVPALRNLGNRPSKEVAAPEFMFAPYPAFPDRKVPVHLENGHWVYADGDPLSDAEVTELEEQHAHYGMVRIEDRDGVRWVKSRTGGVPGDEGFQLGRGPGTVFREGQNPFKQAPIPLAEPIERGNRI